MIELVNVTLHPIIQSISHSIILSFDPSIIQSFFNPSKGKEITIKTLPPSVHSPPVTSLFHRNYSPTASHQQHFWPV